MTHKAKIITVLTGILVVSGIGIVSALDQPKRDPCTSPELALLRRIELERGLSGKGKESPEVLHGLEEEEARCFNARAAHEAKWRNATAEEKARGIEEARLEAEQHRKNLEEAVWLEKLSGKPTWPMSLPDSELGIKVIMDPVSKSFIGLNRWIGFVPGKPKSESTYIEIYAGASKLDPLQGVVLINANEGNPVQTPTPTGPVKIISEKDGILTLRSQKGQYGVYNPEDESKGEIVKTPGGVLYYFDLQTRKFQ
jgi:hypothetical protein